MVPYQQFLSDQSYIMNATGDERNKNIKNECWNSVLISINKPGIYFRNPTVLGKMIMIVKP